LLKIALTGKMRSGKDTVAKYLQEKHGFVSFAFGDGIKRIIQEYFPHEYAKGKPRKLLQAIGQFFREYYPDVWVDYLHRDILNYLDVLEFTIGLHESELPNIVITDVRQMNEYEYAKREGYTVIKVEADDELRLERIKNSGDNYSMEDFYHETEKMVDLIPCDYLITNNTTLEDLYEQIEFVVAELKGGENIGGGFNRR
jgi:dephospho-CoA kinase